MKTLIEIQKEASELLKLKGMVVSIHYKKGESFRATETEVNDYLDFIVKNAFEAGKNVGIQEAQADYFEAGKEAGRNGNPGSDEAIDQGCTCPVIDNGHGRGSYYGGFVIDSGCKLHGKK